MWISTWPDPERSEGRYCNVFGFRDLLIKRLHIYADPDFAGADRSRFLWGEAAIAGLGVALLPDHACAEALRPVVSCACFRIGTVRRVLCISSSRRVEACPGKFGPGSITLPSDVASGISCVCDLRPFLIAQHKGSTLRAKAADGLVLELLPRNNHAGREPSGTPPRARSCMTSIYRSAHAEGKIPKCTETNRALCPSVLIADTSCVWAAAPP